MKLDLIRRFRSEKEAEKYLHTRLHHSRFREQALENALRAGRYEEVRQLANDGIAQDAKGKPGLVTRWKQWLIRLAETTGDTSAQAAHLEALYLDRGEMNYYRQLKQLLPKADFDKKVEQFIRHCPAKYACKMRCRNRHVAPSVSRRWRGRFVEEGDEAQQFQSVKFPLGLRPFFSL